MVDVVSTSTELKTMPITCCVEPSKGSSRSDEVRYIEPVWAFSSAELVPPVTDHVGQLRPALGAGGHTP